MKRVSAILLTLAGFALFSGAAGAAPDLMSRISTLETDKAALQRQVAALEARLAVLEGGAKEKADIGAAIVRPAPLILRAPVPTAKPTAKPKPAPKKKKAS